MSLTGNRSPFQVVSVNRAMPFQTEILPMKSSPLKMHAQPFKSKTRHTYSISELLSFKSNAVQFLLSPDALNAFSERNPLPYKTPMKKISHSRLDSEDFDPKKIENRMKQVNYGKLTEGYKNYIEYVPYKQRQRGDPRTPDVYQICSKRSWDGQIKKWRRTLHAFDEITSPEDLPEIRRNLVIINQTPNKAKIIQTDPIRRTEQSRMITQRARTLNFDDLEDE